MRALGNFFFVLQCIQTVHKRHSRDYRINRDVLVFDAENVFFPLSLE